MLRSTYRYLVAVSLVALVGCDLTDDDFVDPFTDGTLSPDQATLQEAVAGQQPTPLILTFELDQPAFRELGFQILSSDPEAVLHDGHFRIPKGETKHLISILPNPDGSGDKADENVIIYVTGHGVRASASIRLLDSDPDGATVAPGSIALTEAGAAGTLSLDLDEPALDDLEFVVDNPGFASLIAPASLTIAAGDSTVDFSVVAIPDANTFDETITVLVTQVGGTGVTTPLGASFVVEITDDDVVDTISSTGSANLTFVGADTVWENGTPRLDDTITLVLEPGPPEPVSFQVASTDPDALQILNTSGDPQPIFTIPAAFGSASSSVTFIARAQQDPDKHSELATVVAYSVEGGVDGGATNPLNGGYANLSVARNILVVDDDILALSLVRTDAGDTLFVSGNAPANIATYDVVLSGGVAPAGGINVIVTSSSPANATPTVAGAFISDVFIPAGSTTASFDVTPALVPAGLATPVNITVQGVLPSGVQNGTLLAQDGFWVAHADNALQLLELSAPVSSLDEDLSTSTAVVTVTRTGNLSLGAGVFQVTVSDPNKLQVDPSLLTFAPGQVSTTFEVSARSDIDIQDHIETVQVYGVQGGQGIGATITFDIIDDDEEPMIVFSDPGMITITGFDLVEGSATDSTAVITATLTGGSVPVTAIVSSSDPGAVAVSTQILQFTGPGDTEDFTITALPDGDFAHENVEILVLGSLEGDIVANVLAVTVEDDDVPLAATLTPTSSALVEGAMTDVTVSLNQPLPQGYGPLQLAIASSHPGRLLVPDPATVSFAEGQTDATFSVEAAAIAGLQEPVLVTISVTGGNQGQAVFGSTAISVSDPSAPAVLSLELAGGSTTLIEEADSVLVRAVVSNLPDPHLPFVLNVAVSDPGAIETDVASLSFGPSDTVQTFLIRTLGDADVLDEVASAIVSGTVLGNTHSATFTVDVLDEDGPPTLLLEVGGSPVTSISLDEDTDPSETIEATLVGGTGPVAVVIISSDPTAVQSDTNSLIFDGPGATGTFTVSAISDADFLPEQAQLTIFGSVGGQMVGTVLNVSVIDDEGVLSGTISPDPTTVIEGQSTDLTVTLSEPVPAGFGPLVMQLESSSPERLGFGPGGQVQSISEGDSTVTFTVFATKVEGPQAPFDVVVTATGFSLGNAVAASSVVEIVDDGINAALMLALEAGSSDTLSEGADSANVEILVANLPDPHLPFTLNLSVSDPNVLAVSTDQLSFGASDSTATVTVYTAGDLNTGDATASLIVSGTLQGSFQERTLQFFVLDDDGPLTAALSPTVTTIVEGDSGQLTVELSEPLPLGNGPLQLTLFSSNPDRLGFSPDTLGVTIAEGDSTATFPIFTDAVGGLQAPEQVTVSAVGSYLGNLVQATATAVITDGDQPVAVSLSLIAGSNTLAEDADTALVEVTVANLTDPHLPFTLQISNSDPAALSTSVSELFFGPNTFADTFAVYAVSDIDGIDELVLLTVSGNIAGQLGTASTAFAVEDDEEGGVVASLSPSFSVIAEGDTGTLTVSLSEPLPTGNGPLSLTLYSTDIDRLGFDVDTLAVTIAEGDSSASFPVYAGEDEGVQAPQEVMISVLGSYLGELVQATAVAVVSDADQAVELSVTLLSGTTSLTEDGDTTLVEVTVLNLPDPHLPFTFQIGNSDPAAVATSKTELFFGPNTLADTFEVYAVNDPDGLDELVLLSISGPVAGGLGAASQEFTVSDDEGGALTATITPVFSMMEEGDTATLTLELSRPVAVGEGTILFSLDSSDYFRLGLDMDTLAVAIAEGDSTATFPVIAVSNEGPQVPVQVAVTAEGFSQGNLVQATALVNVTDDGNTGLMALELIEGDNPALEGDTLCVRVVFNNLPDPHQAIMMAVTASDPEVLNPQVNMLMIDPTETADTFKVVVREDDNGDADVATINVFGMLQGALVYKTLTIEVIDDELTYVALLEPETNPILEGETTKVFVALDRNVLPQLGDLVLTLTSSDTDRLALVEDTVTIVVGESTACFLAFGVPCVEEDDPQTVRIDARQAVGFPNTVIASTFVTVLDNPQEFNEPLFGGLISGATAGGPAIRLDWRPAFDSETPTSDIRYKVFLSDTSGDHDYENPSYITNPGVNHVILNDQDSPLIQVGQEVFVVVRACDSGAVVVSDTNEVEMVIMPCNPTQVVYHDPDATGPGTGTLADPFVDMQDAVDLVQLNPNGGIVIVDIGDLNNGSTSFPVEFGLGIDAMKDVAVYGRFDFSAMPASATPEQVLAARREVDQGSSFTEGEDDVFEILVTETIYIDGFDMSSNEGDPFIHAPYGAALNLSGLLLEGNSGGTSFNPAGGGVGIFNDFPAPTGLVPTQLRVTGSTFRQLQVGVDIDGITQLVHIDGNLFEDGGAALFLTGATSGSHFDLQLRDNEMRFMAGSYEFGPSRAGVVTAELEPLDSNDETDVLVRIERNLFRSFIDHALVLSGLDQTGDDLNDQNGRSSSELRVVNNEFRLGFGAGVILGSTLDGIGGRSIRSAASGQVNNYFFRNTYDVLASGWGYFDLGNAEDERTVIRIDSEVFRDTGHAYFIEGLFNPKFNTEDGQIDISLTNSVITGASGFLPTFSFFGGLVPNFGEGNLKIEDNVFSHGSSSSYLGISPATVDRRFDPFNEMLVEVLDNTLVGGFNVAFFRVTAQDIGSGRFRMVGNDVLSNGNGTFGAFSASSGGLLAEFTNNRFEVGNLNFLAALRNAGPQFPIPFFLNNGEHLRLQMSGGSSNSPVGGLVLNISNNEMTDAASGGMINITSLSPPGRPVGVMIGQNTITGDGDFFNVLPFAADDFAQVRMSFSGLTSTVFQNNAMGYTLSGSLARLERQGGPFLEWPRVEARNNLFVSAYTSFDTDNDPMPISLINNTFFQVGFTLPFESDRGALSISDFGEEYDPSLALNNIFSYQFSTDHEEINGNRGLVYSHWSLIDHEGPLPGNANLVANPLFTQDGEQRDFDEHYRLHPASPAVDAGIDLNRFRDTDLSTNDMGAYGGPGGGHVGAGALDDPTFDVIDTYNWNFGSEALGFQTTGRLLNTFSGPTAKIFKVYFSNFVAADLPETSFELRDQQGNLLQTADEVSVLGPVATVIFEDPLPLGAILNFRVLTAGIESEFGDPLRMPFYREFPTRPQTPLNEGDDVANGSLGTATDVTGAGPVVIVNGNNDNGDDSLVDVDFLHVGSFEAGQRIEAAIADQTFSDDIRLQLVDVTTGQVINETDDVFQGRPYLSHIFSAEDVANGGEFAIAVRFTFVSGGGNQSYELNIVGVGDAPMVQPPTPD